jgi:molybdopterin synthase sulfur carrier subunit
MRVHVRYFASVREIVGLAQEIHDLPDTVHTVGQTRDWLRAQGGRYALALAADKPLRMACNQVMCDAETALHPNCEVAFFPPVTGG